MENKWSGSQQSQIPEAGGRKKCRNKILDRLTRDIMTADYDFKRDEIRRFNAFIAI